VHRVWLRLATLILLVGCQSVTDVDSRLVLTMTTDRTTLSVGDTAHFVLTLTNQSRASMRIPYWYCPHYFTVVDAAERPSGPPQTVCTAEWRAPVDLAPGASVTLLDRWAADTGEEHSFHTLRVEPGTYTIQGRLAGPERRITSNAIVITVNGAP